jgi:stearoyl-CoA desaturase (delta-9 desaturase)
MPSPPATAPARGAEAPHDDVIYPSGTAFVAAHLACFAAIWTGVTLEALALGFALYLARMFGITAGYHRYFSHRAFKTSRAFQFVLAFLAQSSAQRGVLWWAAKHRWHHLHSDTELDVHSPARSGFLYAHLGWIFAAQHHDSDLAAVPDLARWPELVWLDRHPYLAAIVLGVASWLVAGWPGLVVGFFWSTVALWHATFGINSLAHVLGRQRYVTGDDSRNNWLLAILTLGEGWHNNHHACQSSVRQGFRWWEVDLTFYALKILSWLGIVWDLNMPARSLVAGDQRLGRKVVERVAHQLAATFPVDGIAAQAREALAEARIWHEFRSRAEQARGYAEAALGDLHLPHMPSLEQVRRRAEQRLARTPSLDDIARRTRQVLLEAITARLLKEA